MNEPPRQPVAIAIESYIHAPRVLSVTEVIRQLASVFPDLGRTTIAHRIRKSRRVDATSVAMARDAVGESSRRSGERGGPSIER